MRHILALFCFLAVFSFANSQEAMRVMPIGENELVIGGLTQSEANFRVFNLLLDQSILVKPEADYAISRYVVISPETSQIAPNSYVDFKIYPKNNANLTDMQVFGKVSFAAQGQTIEQDLEIHSFAGSLENDWEELGEFRWIALLGGTLLVWWLISRGS